MGPASLPTRAGQVRCDRLDQPGVSVTGDQPNSAQAAGNQVGEELVPRWAGLAGGYPEAQDFAVSVAVDTGGQQHHRVDHPPAFADLHRQRVGGHERERAGGIQWSMAELFDLLVELAGHPRYLRPAQ